MDDRLSGQWQFVSGALGGGDTTSNEILLQMAAQVAGIGYFLFDLENEIVELCSESHAAIFGRSVEDYLSHSNVLSGDMPMLHPEDFPVVRRAYDRVKEGEQVEFEYRFYRPDGSLGYIREVVAPELKSHGDVARALGSSLDVTRLRHQYLKEDHALRLEAIGTLTAGVAHDFNNTLSVIQGNADLLCENPDADELTQSVDDIRSAVGRGAELIEQLLAFSRKAPLQLEEIDLNTVLQEIAALLERTLPAFIAVQTNKQKDIWCIEADKLQVQNAILNLANNARDAMRQDGVLQMQVHNREVTETHLAKCGLDLDVGSYVVVSLSDTGTGIAPENIERVFEPFYTTKPPGLGSGMGLSMVFGLMRQLGGGTRVVSSLGTGTTFELYFPASKQSGLVPKATRSGRPAKKNARLLLVEDEEHVRETLRKLLTKRGFAVESASDGVKALAKYAKDGPYDVVLTDLVMPGSLQGTHLAASIREITPDAPIVFMSGYPLEAAIGEHDLKADDVHVTKPAAIDDLVAALESVL